MNKPSSPSLNFDAEPTAENSELDRSDRPPKSKKNRRRNSKGQSQHQVDREAIRLPPPKIEIPAELPIAAHRDEIVSLIREHRVIVVCGETGSGKSTQLPKFCIEAGYGIERMIGHTQPRRLAARSIASRLAEEMETTVGDRVGYKVRFGDQTSGRTNIKLMTDGILLAETASDRELDAYDVIIIDEAHERSLNIDFLLGYLKRLLIRRNDLRVIITSATIDAERFAEHFGNEGEPAPIVSVAGRGYPVEIRYLGWEEVVDDENRGYDVSRHVIAGLDSIASIGGDTLVFLPTERDIREVSHRVAGHYKRLGLQNRVELLPLYARLPASSQQRIFHPDGSRRRVIFATNVAESSLTVPGIRHVIDTGTARISRYSSRSRLQRLPIESISQASANQRAGRCGRIGPGVCVRLFDLDDFESRDAFTTPEIRRANLASVVLQMKALRLGKLEDFPLIDPPRPENIREGMRTLAELGAIDDQQELTPIGKRLGRLPVDPRVGRMIIAASDEGVLAEVLPIAASLEIPDVRVRPVDKKEEADRSHTEFTDPRSDFLSQLRLWRFYQEQKETLSRSALKRTLVKRFLSPTRMREWTDTHRQLKELARSISLHVSRDPNMIGANEGAEPKKNLPGASAAASHPAQGSPKTETLASGRKKNRDLINTIGSPRYIDHPKFIVEKQHDEAIHRALMTGLLFGIANQGEKNAYTGAGGLKLFIWPGSGIFESKPKWIMAAELVETAKPFARTVAKIQPSWIEPIGEHLLKDHHFEPHFSSRQNGAYCYLNRTLFGLPVVTRRRVALARIDPITSRDLIIEPGLIEDQMTTSARFVQHNRQLIASIVALGAKMRRRDLVIDPYRLAAFYQSRLPADVVDRASLEAFDKGCDKPTWTNQCRNSADVSSWLADPPARDESDAQTPYMRPDDLIDLQVESLDAEAYPDELKIGKTKLPLSYRYAPGEIDDGIAVTVPREALSQISDERVGWLVPGLLEAKIVTCIKSLPKRHRRNLVPAADTARIVAEQLADDRDRVAFLPRLCQALSSIAEQPITPEDFQTEKLDPALEMLVRVIDDNGKTLDEDRSVRSLQKRLDSSSKARISRSEKDPVDDQTWSRDSMQTFDIEDLPKEIVCVRGGVEVAQFPGLRLKDNRVQTWLYSDPEAANRGLLTGLTWLFARDERKSLRSQVRHLPGLPNAKMKLASIVKSTDFDDELSMLMSRIAFIDDRSPVRTAASYDVVRGEKGQRISGAAQDLAGWLAPFSDAYQRVRLLLEEIKGSPKFHDATHDIRNQIRMLTCDGFLASTPWNWLQHYPRYFEAIAYRIDKFQSGAMARDIESMKEIHRLWNRMYEKLPSDTREPLSLIDHQSRWLIEELRVSLFAQPLGTSQRVSSVRIEKAID
ncbi:MAG: ATP-dependent RNA helicase HrpA [Planctomycetota bacterium]